MATKSTKPVEKKVEVKPITTTTSKAEPKQETTKVVEKNVEIKKETAKSTAKKVEPKKEVAKTSVKKVEPKKETKKVSAKKTAKKEITTEKIVVQFYGKEYDIEAVKESAKAHYITNGGKKTISSIEVYIKPEDNGAYYVINDVKGFITL